MDFQDLPVGWDAKYDPRCGRYYFINLYNKTTTWDDPRLKYRQIQGGPPSHISSEGQQMHGSPYHVYPASSSIYPAQAFQNPSTGVPSVSASPLFNSKMSHHHNQLEMSSLSRSIPQTPRMGQLVRQHLQQQHQQQQETSFTNPIDVDSTVAKINSMFPTVPDTHIRVLLKKYYNREAVVISALQVEKHPLTTPGPYTTPPPPRHFHSTAVGVISAFQMTPTMSRKGDGTTLGTSSNGSPIPPRPNSCASGSYGYPYSSSPRFGEIYRGSPKPHSSPKMKLRYMKGIFPKAEETIILDVLASVDNNVQKASEKLLKMGYEKKDSAGAPRLSNRKNEEKKREREFEPTPPPKPKSAEEKKKLKTRLQTQYKDIAERIISMALESVDYSEDKAVRILDIVITEDTKDKDKIKDKKKKSEKEKKPKEAELVEKNVSFKEARNTVDGVAVAAEKELYNNALAKLRAQGVNKNIYKGPNDELLLADYVAWNGANPTLTTNKRILAQGVNTNLRCERSYLARGSNADLFKGTKIGLAKGSMYAQLSRPLNNVACN